MKKMFYRMAIAKESFCGLVKQGCVYDVVKISGENVIIKRSDGKRVEVPRSVLGDIQDDA